MPNIDNDFVPLLLADLDRVVRDRTDAVIAARGEVRSALHTWLSESGFTSETGRAHERQSENRVLVARALVGDSKAISTLYQGDTVPMNVIQELSALNEALDELVVAQQARAGVTALDWS